MAADSLATQIETAIKAAHALPTGVTLTITHAQFTAAAASGTHAINAKVVATKAGKTATKASLSITVNSPDKVNITLSASDFNVAVDAAGLVAPTLKVANTEVTVTGPTSQVAAGGDIIVTATAKTSATHTINGKASDTFTFVAPNPLAANGVATVKTTRRRR